MAAAAQIIIDRVNHLYRPPRGREVLALDRVSQGSLIASSSRCSNHLAVENPPCSISLADFYRSETGAI
jgi:hypothetical protein